MMRRLLPLLLAAFAGLSVADALWRGATRSASTAPPPGLSREQATVPYQLAELSGALAYDPDYWNLDFYRALSGTSGPTAISGTARLPGEGRLELWPASPQSRPSTGLILSRVGPPTATVVTRSNSIDTPARCDGTLPGPSDAPLPVSIAPSGGGVTVTVGGTTVQCSGRLAQAGPELRPGLRRVQIADLSLGDAAIPAPGPSGRLVWWLLGGAAASGLIFIELLSGARLALVLLTTLPLLLGFLLGPKDMQPWVEAMRASWLPPEWLAGGIPIALTLFAKLTHHLGRALTDRDTQRPWWWALVATAPAAIAAGTVSRGFSVPVAVVLGLLGGVGVAFGGRALLSVLGSRESGRAVALVAGLGSLAGVGIALTGPLHQIAVPLLFGAGALWGVLVWANANASQIRFYNPVSLLAVVLGLVCLEVGVRYTPAGIGWGGGGSRTQLNDMYGWVDVANEEFALIEEGAHTDYPDKGFPVAIPGADARTRIVAMGGSTTGGAYQNDNLSEFYPARLSERLGDRFMVANQGVGGWTTWHIRHYLADHLDALAPDVLTLYVGHNDALTPVPMPYSQLYSAWKMGGARSTSSALSRVRLYQAFRFFLVSLTPPSQRVAVPLNDAEDNLRFLIEAVTGRGGKVLLASEGLAPDPGPLVEYNALMARLAAEHSDVGYVDTAAALYARPSARMFLDDCHLTDDGHRLVAEELESALQEMGAIQ
ncbi:MAG: lysophospholipase L1-like esterase [Myxococcota bacterium]|jgi:lysophospholipase L1-like esterase